MALAAADTHAVAMASEASAVAVAVAAVVAVAVAVAVAAAAAALVVLLLLMEWRGLEKVSGRSAQQPHHDIWCRHRVWSSSEVRARRIIIILLLKICVNLTCVIYC